MALTHPPVRNVLPSFLPGSLDPALTQLPVCIHPLLAIHVLSRVATNFFNHKGQDRCFPKLPWEQEGNSASCIQHSASPIASLGSPDSPAGTDEGGSHSTWQQRLLRPGRAQGRKRSISLWVRWAPSASPFPQPAALWAAGGYGAGPYTHAGRGGKLLSRSLSPQVRVKLLPRASCACAQCCWGRAHPAALQLSRRTKPLWGLEGLSHTARRVWGSLPVTILWRSGLGGCCAPERNKSPRRCTQKEISL